MSKAEQTRSVFKECPNCGLSWESRDRFLSDPCVEIVGYQPHFEELTAGFCLFNHSCETTVAVPISELRDLYDGPVYQERKTGSDECPGYCLNREELTSCPAQCECAYVREVVQIITRYPKDPG